VTCRVAIDGHDDHCLPSTPKHGTTVSTSVIAFSGNFGTSGSNYGRLVSRALSKGCTFSVQCTTASSGRAMSGTSAPAHRAERQIGRRGAVFLRHRNIGRVYNPSDELKINSPECRSSLRTQLKRDRVKTVARVALRMPPQIMCAGEVEQVVAPLAPLRAHRSPSAESMSIPFLIRAPPVPFTVG